MQIHDWMQNTRAAEIMVRDVVTLKPNDVLAEAAAVLLREQISGAPVLDEFGACEGVLSVSDIIHAEAKIAEARKDVATSSFWNSNLALPANESVDRLEALRDRIAPIAERPVSRFMSTNLVTVTDDTPLQTVVQCMVEAHIHRVLVVNSGRALRGIISSTDLLATLLRANESPPDDT